MDEGNTDGEVKATAEAAKAAPKWAAAHVSGM